MGFRFRRSLGLGKLLRINVGKTGASVSVGVKGARVNLGSRGARVTAGIPGTGISYSTTASHSPHSSTTSSRSSAAGCFTAIAYVGLVTFSCAGITAAVGKPLPGLIGSVGILLVVLLLDRRGKALRARAASAAVAEQDERNRSALAHQEAERLREREARWEYLRTKYGETDAQKIWKGHIWTGCTAEVLIEVLGPPEAVDEKVLKTKTKHTFKYRPTGTNRYSLRVFLDDGKVVGWQDNPA